MSPRSSDASAFWAPVALASASLKELGLVGHLGGRADDVVGRGLEAPDGFSNAVDREAHRRRNALTAIAALNDPMER